MCRESVLCCTLSVLAAAQQGKDDRSGGNMVCDTLQFQWSPGPRLMRWITGKLFKKANKKTLFHLIFVLWPRTPCLILLAAYAAPLSAVQTYVLGGGLLLMGATKIWE